MKEFNEDELETPQWINEQFLKNILENNDNTGEISITDIVISPATGKGDHFASIMFCAKINYTLLTSGEPKCQSIIIKAMPVKEGKKKDILESKPFFETEIGMYTEVLPNVEKVLNNIGDNDKLCARVLYSSLKPEKCIIFEDLRDEGYVVSSNCTLEEVTLSLSKLAKYHAVTHKMLMEGDTSLQRYKQQFFNNTERTRNVYSLSIKSLVNATKNYERLQKYASYMDKLDYHFVGMVLEMVNNDCVKERSKMLVLTHGDFHKKNMMMKYNEGVLESLLLLDFQLSCCGSLVQDLLYAYFMLFTPEMRLSESRKKIFGAYFKIYQSTLQLLGYSGHIPTKEEFDNELKKFKKFELFLLAFMLPIGYCFGDCLNDIANLVDPDVRKKVYERPELLKELEYLLQWYIDEGYFDELN